MRAEAGPVDVAAGLLGPSFDEPGPERDPGFLVAQVVESGVVELVVGIPVRLEEERGLQINNSFEK